MMRVFTKKINNRILKNGASATIEMAVFIAVVLLVFLSAQPYVYRSLQGLWRGQIDQLKEPPSFESLTKESSRYVPCQSSGYDIYDGASWNSQLTGYYESMKQELNRGNTSVSFIRTATFSGSQQEPRLDSDTDRINL